MEWYQNGRVRGRQEKGAYRLSSSSSLCASMSFCEYHGVRSFALGARGMPFSDSDSASLSFPLASLSSTRDLWMALAMELYLRWSLRESEMSICTERE